MSSSKRSSFPWLVILVLVIGGAYWWYAHRDEDGFPLLRRSIESDTMQVFRVPGGSLSTAGLTKTEQFSKKDEDEWWGTTSSVIRLDATYRYDIELRADWKFVFDPERNVAFVVVPELKPQLPVSIDSSTIQEETSSGWARFDKWEHLAALRKKISRELEKKANGRDYRDVVRGQARLTVEEFVSDWLVRQPEIAFKERPVVKVYFETEEGIPFPKGRSLSDFVP